MLRYQTKPWQDKLLTACIITWIAWRKMILKRASKPLVAFSCNEIIGSRSEKGHSHHNRGNSSQKSEVELVY